MLFFIDAQWLLRKIGGIDTHTADHIFLSIFAAARIARSAYF